MAGASLGALAIGQMLPIKVAEAARLAGLIDVNGNGYIPTMCEMCVWRCGVLAKVENWPCYQTRGNPEHAHSLGNLCARGQAGLMNTYDPDRVRSCSSA